MTISVTLDLYWLSSKTSYRQSREVSKLRDWRSLFVIYYAYLYLFRAGIDNARNATKSFDVKWTLSMSNLFIFYSLQSIWLSLLMGLHNNVIKDKCSTYMDTSNGSWCIGIKGEMSGTVCVTFTWDIYIYIWVVYSFCLFCCLFIIVTWWYIWCIVWQVASKRKYRHVW